MFKTKKIRATRGAEKNMTAFEEDWARAACGIQTVGPTAQDSADRPQPRCSKTVMLPLYSVLPRSFHHVRPASSATTARKAALEAEKST